MQGYFYSRDQIHFLCSRMCLNPDKIMCFRWKCPEGILEISLCKVAAFTSVGIGEAAAKTLNDEIKQFLTRKTTFILYCPSKGRAFIHPQIFCALIFFCVQESGGGSLLHLGVGDQ